MRGACLSSRPLRTELYLSIIDCRAVGGFLMSSDDATSSQNEVMSILLRRQNEYVRRGGGCGGHACKTVKMGKWSDGEY